MGKLTKTLPFTEIVERVMDLSRSATKDIRRVKGIVNDIYTMDIPRAMDWEFLKSSSALSCVVEIKSGVAYFASTQGTAVCFSGLDVTLDGTHSGRKIKFSDNNNVYDFTFLATNSGIIAPPLSGVANISNGAYTIYKNIFSLASDFDRFPINGGLLYYSAGQPTPLSELVDSEYYDEATASPTSIPDGCRFVGYDTAGNLQVEIIPPPSTSYVLPYEYIKVLEPMIENTGGTVVITSNSTAITGTGTLFTQAKTGDYIRVDAFGTNEDSQWYQIHAIATNTNMTLTKVFRSDTNATTSSYTICSAPQMPYRLQDAVIYGGLRNLIIDQNDPNYVFYHAKYSEVLSNNKVIVKTRKTDDTVPLVAEEWDYRR